MAYHLAMSANGSFAASSALKGDVALYSLSDSKLLHTFPFIHLGPGTDSAASLALSPDGKYLAIGTMTNHIYIYDVASGTLLNTIKVYPGEFGIGVGALAFSPNSEFLAGGAGLSASARKLSNGTYEAVLPDHALNVWRVKDARLVASYPPEHTDMVRHISWSPDGVLVAFACGDHTVRLWSPQTPNDPGIMLRFPLTPITAPMTALISPDGTYLGVAVGSDVNLFIIHDHSKHI